MTGRATLGDFLGAARGHLDAAAGGSIAAESDRDLEEMSRGLRRLAAALGSYVAPGTAAASEPAEPGMPANSPAAATVRAHDAFVSAAACLGEDDAGAPCSETGSEQARQLHAAATSLAAGSDLLQSHFATDPKGAQLYRSEWALVIVSQPFRRALLDEIASLSQQAASLSASVGLPAGSIRDRASEARNRLALAGRLLWLAGAAVRDVYRLDPVMLAERELLHAMPGSALPERCVPDGSEPVPGLCEGVITAAERVSRAAWAAAGLQPWSAAISVTSWRRIAEAGTVTSHHCDILLTALAQASAGEVSAGLLRAAASARSARSVWLRTARDLNQVTTETRRHVSQAAVEAADLALWTGRLGYAEPDWDLASGPSRPVRPPASLAASPADVGRVLGAVHYAADALARLAVANQEQARAAARARRILVPARSLPERFSSLRPYAVASQNVLASLQSACPAAPRPTRRTRWPRRQQPPGRRAEFWPPPRPQAAPSPTKDSPGRCRTRVPPTPTRRRTGPVR